jgi:hypothetical protein
VYNTIKNENQIDKLVTTMLKIEKKKKHKNLL